MSGKIIDGKALAKQVRIELKEKINQLEKKPKLVVVLVGDNPASHTYVRNKERMCKRVGIISERIDYETSVSEETLLNKIKELNKNPSVNGILVQLPLPDHIDEFKIIETIAPEKDVDGFHTESLGKLLIGKKSFIPATPFGIMQMFESINIDLKGKEAVVVGRSNIVGKPTALLLLARHATVTVCHSRTKHLPEVTKRADILVAAVGKKHIITKDMIKPGAIVIDVGINEENGKLYGDVDFEAVKEVAEYITPVPGGVGPMTIAMLLCNTYDAFCLQNQ